MTYAQAAHWGTEQLQRAGVTDAKIDAGYLLEMAAKIDRSFYYMHMQDEMSADQYMEYERVIRKRAERVPLQYITGEQEFMGLTFHVNSNVLIPRQDTETLVEEVLKHVREEMHILDLCTGSGCILISILKNAPQLVGAGSDVSKQALLVAKENAKLHDVDADWIRGNLFDNITEKYDVIVSNPPYIRSREVLNLMPEVQQFEPLEALDGGEDGLDFYRKICEKAPEYLNAGGWLFLEIGYDEGPQVKAMMELRDFVDVEIKKDLAGLDRVVYGRMPG